MELIKTHIFSFDRPAQLELLLSSIRQNDVNRQLSVAVQYAYSAPAFQEGYNILKERFPEIVYLNEEHYESRNTINPLHGDWIFNTYLWLRNYRFRFYSSNFRDVLLSSLFNTDNEYVMFLTDDSIFYREIKLNNYILNIIKESPESAYSLALGKNIKGGKYQESPEHISWDLKRRNFSGIWYYPFSVDGRIYNKGMILENLQKLSFTNPNTFEAIMVLYHKHKNIFAKILANYESSLVGFELNRVQNTYLNNNIGLDHHEINDYYLRAFKLNIDFDLTAVDKFRPDIRSVYLSNGLKLISLINIRD